MPNKKRILFIINPNSGKKDSASVIELIPKHLDKNKFEISTETTQHAGHATEIARQAVEGGMDIVVAVGGDGMVNEVFQSLVNTNAAFSIIPKGSGNGVARSFGIPMNTIKAIEKLNSASFSTVDTCIFNDKPFLGVAGIGFDGTISALFANNKKRGLKTYIKLILSQFLGYSSHNYKITTDEAQFECKAFIVAFANTQQYGNNAVIAPFSMYDDGKIDLVIFKVHSKWLTPFLALKVMTNAIQHSKYVRSYKTSFVQVTTTALDAHIDGEPITAGVINEISIVPHSLKVYL